MAGLAKRTKRAVKRVTMAWRYGLIEHAPAWMKQHFGPTASYLDMLFIDHGIFRFAYLNKHKLSEGVWRSAQPAPHHIKSLKRQGIKTILNLRGERVCGSYWYEERLCKQLGIELINFQVRSRAAPSREDVLGAKKLFETIEYPMLMHCKSGADRAGLMSVIYRHVREGWPIEKALSELSWKYGHIRQADTGVLDQFFERYLDDNAMRPMPFLEWVETVYDADELQQSFRANGWANRLVNNVLQRE